MYVIYNRSMKELKHIIADNLINLRKANKLTQLELATKLNYSDKAISKWERGDSMPDIFMFKELADMYGVTLDYMMTEHSDEEAQKYKKKDSKLSNKLIITLLSCVVVWICATIIYVNLNIVQGINYWMVWLWAIPVSAIILLVFSSIWAHKRQVLTCISLLVWSLLTCTYVQLILFDINIWTIFLLGIPIQIAILLWGKLKSKK